jgi:hypothetical protein
MDTTLEASERKVSAREAMSAFSGLALLCVLVAALAASTFIASGEGAATPDVSKYPPQPVPGDHAPVPSITFYLFDSEARLEESRELVELAEDQVGQIPLQTYPHAVTLLARTPDEEALAHVRIVEQVRSSKGKPVRIEVLDLRAQTP